MVRSVGNTEETASGFELHRSHLGRSVFHIDNDLLMLEESVVALNPWGR